jgi:hypothetical protein
MRMLRPLLFALLSTLCILSSAQVTPPPPPAHTKTEDKAPNYSQEGFVVEKWNTTYTFQNDGTGKRELYVRVKVQNEAGVQQWGQVVLGYSSANERVEIPYVRVLKADSSTVTAGPDAVQDLSSPIEREAPLYSDYRQKHITVPGLRPGDTLEYDVVSVIATALAPGQFWMEHSFSKVGIVLDEQLEINLPRDRQVKLKTQPGFDPKITDTADRRVYSWSSSHRERDDDDDKPKKKAAKHKEPEPPAVQLTTFATWEDMGKWYAGLEKDRREPTADIRAKAVQLTTGKSSDLD